MLLSLFSSLHMRAFRLKPYHQAEARRTRCEVTEGEKGSLPPARGILPRDLPGAHRGSASVREVDRRLHPRSVWQMVTVFLSLLACMFGFLPPHFKRSLSPLSLSSYSFLASLLVKYSRKSFGLVQSVLMAMGLFINFIGFEEVLGTHFSVLQSFIKGNFFFYYFIFRLGVEHGSRFTLQVPVPSD